jgi:Kef-type K+ transport system membrane component KefB
MFSVLGGMSERQNAITPPVLTTVLILLMACAWFTDTIGIYAIFGAFILGVAMPSGFFADRLTAVLEPLVTTFLLPLFFVYSGLNTQVGLLNSASLWAVTLGILLVSILGKGVACTLAARLKKVPWRESVALGSLMNARGLIELILLNIGLQAGIITPALFTILVLVAIFTTLMATPVFERVYGRYRVDEAPDPEAPDPEDRATAPSDDTAQLRG